MKTRIAVAGLFAGLSLLVALGSAQADRLRIGGSFSIHPIGQIKLAVDDESESADTETAFGIGGALEYQLHPNFAIGFAPRLLLSVKVEDADDSAKQLDLPLRLIAGAPVAQNVHLYGFGAPGYSILFVPDSDGLDNPAGFIFGLGGGVGFDINPQFRLAGEIGYHFGFQKVDEQGITVDVNTSFFHLGVVAMAVL